MTEGGSPTKLAASQLAPAGHCRRPESTRPQWMAHLARWCNVALAGAGFWPSGHRGQPELPT